MMAKRPSRPLADTWRSSTIQSASSRGPAPLVVERLEVLVGSPGRVVRHLRLAAAVALARARRLDPRAGAG
eukprot:scaffold7695_cov124-Isochrysis_galbana.AAC.11